MKINEIVQESEIKPTKRNFKLSAKTLAHNNKFGLGRKLPSLKDLPLNVRTPTAVVSVKG
jgi:hypothetical protein|tara:strand:+ start:1354 stop:1533 length:180 start_codon:yes stop_codon:yes gene_type:complete